ncbi:MAG: YbaB/EbfC family nucleoid-associated protein [Phycisphaerales bacterium]|nr:YbaB/EbfC family nucleoid-associated protein [Phycisphaerales bacterium]
MFDQFKNLGQLSSMLRNAGQLREQMKQVQDKLKTMKASAETGGGAVKATVTGAMRVASLQIDPAMFAALIDAGSDADRQMAEDLIAGAINAAMEKAQRMAADEMSRRARELGLPIDPGADLGGLLGE